MTADFDALRRGVTTYYAGERVYVSKSGAAVSAWTSARLVGDPKVVLLVVENVTARHAAEAALRESEERFQLAMRGANEGLYDWRIAGEQDLSLAALEIHARLWRGRVRRRARLLGRRSPRRA